MACPTACWYMVTRPVPSAPAAVLTPLKMADAPSSIARMCARSVTSSVTSLTAYSLFTRNSGRWRGVRILPRTGVASRSPPILAHREPGVLGLRADVLFAFLHARVFARQVRVHLPCDELHDLLDRGLRRGLPVG